ncbi:MAG: 5-formyltetrahydrofolate cyclo-ligase [Ruminococcaceae bacterium]|nr:5-formyltetrahydrofolate cyclo-ligase [Oscillospiraceae bacterium]
MSKASLRKVMLSYRRELSKEEVVRNSQQIFTKIRPILEDKQSVMVYLSFQNEVDTFALLDWLWEQKKNVAVPVCDTKAFEIFPSVLNSSRELVHNKYGILEPDIICTPDFCYDAVVIPGIAFDLSGNRIGFGKGYYDKFLSTQKNNPLKIGLCHDFQLLSDIPSEPHDFCMDYIITERRTVRI